MKLLAVLTTFALATTALAAEPRDTMCVKQKNGTYKCRASGKDRKQALLRYTSQRFHAKTQEIVTAALRPWRAAALSSPAPGLPAPLTCRETSTTAMPKSVGG
jgi:hypothetical protein